MKKYLLYGLILLLGILLGYLFFGNSSETEPHKHGSSLEESKTWTCSMHPQIKKSEPGDCPICGMELIPADEANGKLQANQFEMTPNAMALANIQTTKVGQTTASENLLNLSGKIEANEKTNAVQTAYMDGRIEQMHIRSKGEKVSKGQLLATLYSPELISAQQELLTAAKNNQERLYQAVRKKLKAWKLSENKITAIEKSGEITENFPIHATVSGTVSEKIVSEGDYVKEGQALLKIADFNKVWAVFDAYENQVSALEKGQKIDIIPNAYPEKTYEATLSFINPIFNTTTRTVNVRAELENSDGKLKPGMFINGHIAINKENSTKSLSIPKSAVLWTGEQSVVYVKTQSEKPVFEMRTVRIATETGENYSITEGLKNGEEIVTHGTFTVDATAQLQGKKSMMSQSTEQFDLSEKFQQQLSLAIKDYLAMKDAFVRSDAENVSISAQNMLEQLILDSKNESVKNTVASLKKSLQTISKTTDITKQRNVLVSFSDEFIALVKNIPSSEKLYIQECPMANNNKGARWLSTEKEIRNPYYGEKMLNCGSVINSL